MLCGSMFWRTAANETDEESDLRDEDPARLEAGRAHPFHPPPQTGCYPESSNGLPVPVLQEISCRAPTEGRETMKPWQTLRAIFELTVLMVMIFLIVTATSSDASRRTVHHKIDCCYEVIWVKVGSGGRLECVRHTGDGSYTGRPQELSCNWDRFNEEYGWNVGTR